MAETREDLPRQSQSVTQKTLLVVDDDECILMVYKALLEDKGFKVLTSADGGEALQMCCANPDQFAVVLADQCMPGLSGIEFSQKLFKVCPEILVIICTGSANITKLETRDTSIKKILVKPINIEFLVESILEIMKK